MKKMFHRLFVRMLVPTGLTSRTASDLVDVLARFKGKLVLLFVAGIVSPLLELSFIGILYTMVSPGGREAVPTWLERAGLGPFYEWLGGDARYWALLIGAALLALLLLQGIRVCEQLFLAYFRYLLTTTYMHRLVVAYLGAPPAAILTFDRNRLSSAVLSEAVAYGKFVYSLLCMISMAISVGLFLASAALISYQLLLVSSLVAGFTMLIVRRAYRQGHTISKQRVRVQVELVSRLFDVVQGFRVVKLEQAERRLGEHMREFLFTSQRWRLRKGVNEMFLLLTSEGVLYLALLVIIVMSLLVFRIGSASVLVFLVLMARLQKYLASVQQRYLQLRTDAASLEAVQDVLAACAPAESPQVRFESPASDVPANAPASIRLEGVSFTYPRLAEEAADSGPAVSDVNLELRPGDRVLIQGPSGQGKSTLLHLVTGILKPTSGRVLYDGAPLTDQDFDRFRQAIGYAAPDLHLFRTSIRENLCIGREYSEEGIERAVQLSGLAPVVQALPRGLDSFIGENGNQLSLGERQRVMLARVFLKRPRIVLLDEATSNLDQALEHEVIQRLYRQLGPDGTLVMVTHKRPLRIEFTREHVIRHGRLRERTPETTQNSMGVKA